MGETAAFQIRDFPVLLREELVRAAKEADQTVGEFLAAVCVQAQRDGWVRAVDVTTPANGLTNLPGPETARNIATLVDAACRLAATKNVAKEVRRLANAALARQLAREAELTASVASISAA